MYKSNVKIQCFQRLKLLQLNPPAVMNQPFETFVPDVSKGNDPRRPIRGIPFGFTGLNRPEKTKLIPNSWELWWPSLYKNRFISYLWSRHSPQAPGHVRRMPWCYYLSLRGTNGICTALGRNVYPARLDSPLQACLSSEQSLYVLKSVLVCPALIMNTLNQLVLWKSATINICK